MKRKPGGHPAKQDETTAEDGGNIWIHHSLDGRELSENNEGAA